MTVAVDYERPAITLRTENVIRLHFAEDGLAWAEINDIRLKECVEFARVQTPEAQRLDFTCLYGDVRPYLPRGLGNVTSVQCALQISDGEYVPVSRFHVDADSADLVFVRFSIPVVPPFVSVDIV